MDPVLVLGLMTDLYAQVQELAKENARLREQLHVDVDHG